MPQFKSWWDFIRFAESVRHGFRFIHDARVHDFLDALAESSITRRTTIKSNTLLWRAQRGHAVHEQHDHADADLHIVIQQPIPYPPDRMKPLPGSGHEGRANPKGIPYLYLSTDATTAMAEVRPWLDSYLSLGRFKVLGDLSVIDFSTEDDDALGFYAEEPPCEQRERIIWAQMNRAFSRPITNDDATAEYVPTQVIAETLRHNGVDGLMYSSALGTGRNVALFRHDAAVLVQCVLNRVKQIAFEFEEDGDGYDVSDQ